jgi:hypothetical protein
MYVIVTNIGPDFYAFFHQVKNYLSWKFRMIPVSYTCIYTYVYYYQ